MPHPRPWPTPVVADGFVYPLWPADAYGPYVQGASGPLNVDTRYGVQNPAQGERANCFRDANGEPVPFRQLYHAGVDLFAFDGAGRVVWGEAAGASIHAVAEGVVVATLSAGGEGNVLIIGHRLADDERVYSVYWHVGELGVAPGQPVARGEVVGAVHDLGLNSHLHWEMRRFADGLELFPPGSAGARGRCNGHVAGVGYTWDDDPERAHPDAFGYLDPPAFIAAHAP